MCMYHPQCFVLAVKQCKKQLQDTEVKKYLLQCIHSIVCLHNIYYVCVCSPQDFRKVEGLIKALHNGLTHEPATCTHPSLQKTSCKTSQYTYVQSY